MRRGTRRRQKGGGRIWWVLLGAVAALQGTSATKTPAFAELVSNWWEKGDIQSSVNLANAITEGKYLPTVEWTNPFGTQPIPPSVVEPPSAKQKKEVEEIVHEYILPNVVDKVKIRVGDTYEFVKKSDGTSQHVYILESVRPGEWVSDPPISSNDWDLYDVRGPIPVETGGKRRKHRRKTLRRRK